MRDARQQGLRRPDWLFEIKWDGFRVQAVVRDGDVRLFTRNLNDAETYFGRLLSPPSWIDAREAIVDGEVVALDENGVPTSASSRSGSASCARGRRTSGPLVYQPFDLLYYDGRSLLEVPLESRKRLLKTVLREHPRVRFASHVDANGWRSMPPPRSAASRGSWPSCGLALRARPPLERMAQDQDPARAGARRRRLDAWKAMPATSARCDRVYEDGRCAFRQGGSGFTGVTRKRLLERLAPLVSDDPPFDPPPERKGELRNVTGSGPSW